jgi:hypothetical protein
VLAASFDDPASWLARLEPERRLALTSIFNRLCTYGLWCHVRLVLAVAAAEAPVSIGDLDLAVPGRTAAVYFVSAGASALLEALEGSGRFCQATGAGASQHPGQTTLREVSSSDSLHVSIGPGNQFDAHIDHHSPVTAYPPGGLCPNEPTPAAVGHIATELVPEIVREGFDVLGLHIPGPAGFQFFPEPAAPEPEGAPVPEPPGGAPVPSVAGITLRGPRTRPAPPVVPAEARRVSPDVAALPADVAARIEPALEEQVSPEALLPSYVRARRTQARRALELAGPGEEDALRVKRDEAEAEAASYADARTVALDLAGRMEHARQSGDSRVTIDLGERYGPLDAASRRAIAGEIRRIVLILRHHLPHGAQGVRWVLVIFGAGRGRESEVIELP